MDGILFCQKLHKIAPLLPITGIIVIRLHGDVQLKDNHRPWDIRVIKVIIRVLKDCALTDKIIYSMHHNSNAVT